MGAGPFSVGRDVGGWSCPRRGRWLTRPPFRPAGRLANGERRWFSCERWQPLASPLTLPATTQPSQPAGKGGSGSRLWLSFEKCPAGVVPDTLSYGSAASACADRRQHEHALALRREMSEAGIHSGKSVRLVVRPRRFLDTKAGGRGLPSVPRKRYRPLASSLTLSMA